jgi:hypothetical protein
LIAAMLLAALSSPVGAADLMVPLSAPSMETIMKNTNTGMDRQKMLVCIVVIVASIGWLIARSTHLGGKKDLTDTQRLTAIQKRIQEIQNDPNIPDRFKQQGLGVLRGREEALKAGHAETETGVR